MSRANSSSKRIQNTVCKGLFLVALAVFATGSTLQKNAGCDGCDDAGGSSDQSLAADGFVEFTVGEMGTFWVAGLNHGDETTFINDIDFDVRRR